MADISIQQQQGHMYSVIVNVREDDTKLRTDAQAQSISDPSALFSAENARDYDTD